MFFDHSTEFAHMAAKFYIENNRDLALTYFKIYRELFYYERRDAVEDMHIHLHITKRYWEKDPDYITFCEELEEAVCKHLKKMFRRKDQTYEIDDDRKAASANILNYLINNLDLLTDTSTTYLEHFRTIGEVVLTDK